METKRLYTVRMLAQRFRPYGITAEWLKSEAEAGRLPCLRIGRRMLFDADSVEVVLIQRAAQREGGAE